MAASGVGVCRWKRVRCAILAMCSGSVVFHQPRHALAEASPTQIIRAQTLMTDHAKPAHVLGILSTDMPDIVKERRQHHFIVEAFGHGQFGGLGHVLDLRHRLTDVVAVAKALVQREDFGDHLFMALHQSSPNNSATLRSAIAGPTLMPTPVCINATPKPFAGRRNENGPGPREP